MLVSYRTIDRPVRLAKIASIQIATRMRGTKFGYVWDKIVRNSKRLVVCSPP